MKRGRVSEGGWPLEKGRLAQSESYELGDLRGEDLKAYHRIKRG